MRRPLLFAVLLAAVLALSAHGAGSADWDKLPYLSVVGSQALITTDGSWSGADAVPLPALYRPGQSSNPLFATVKRDLIWAPACGQAAERRTFSKSFTLPGDPISGRFELYYGGGRERPYEFATLSVNGVVIARLGKTAGFAPGKGAAPTAFGELAPGARRAFKHGANLVRIDVAKAALKPGERCSIPKDGRYVGVFGEVFLQFGGDLLVQAPRVPRTVQKNVTNGQSVPVQGTATFRNLGPSTALAGTLQINISGPGVSAIQELSVGAPIYGCERDGSQISCKYRELRAGQSASINYIGGTKVNTGFFRGGTEKMLTIVSIQTPSNFPDPKGLNNSQKAEIVLCTADASDPACK